MPAIVSLRDRAVVANTVFWAKRAPARSRGLLGRAPLLPGQALVIVGGGGQVHTFGMSYAIDVLFCDRRWVVLHAVRGLRPNRVTRWVRGCRYVVELVAGALPEAITPGTELTVRAEPGS